MGARHESVTESFATPSAPSLVERLNDGPIGSRDAEAVVTSDWATADGTSKTTAAARPTRTAAAGRRRAAKPGRKGRNRRRGDRAARDVPGGEPCRRTVPPARVMTAPGGHNPAPGSRFQTMAETAPGPFKTMSDNPPLPKRPKRQQPRTFKTMSNNSPLPKRPKRHQPVGAYTILTCNLFKYNKSRLHIRARRSSARFRR